MLDKLPVRIVVGIDGSTNSLAALKAIASRAWPSGTEVRLVAALDTLFCVDSIPRKSPDVKWLVVTNENDMVSLKQIFDALAEELRQVGLTVSIELKEGDPKDLLIEEAESWNADSIFVGAKGTRGIERLLLGVSQPPWQPVPHVLSKLFELKKTPNRHVSDLFRRSENWGPRRCDVETGQRTV